MENKKILDERVDCLKWVEPTFPPRVVEREVVFSLMRYGQASMHGHALYFVNGSDEVLDVVSSDIGGFTGDLLTDDNPSFLYKSVLPHQSVKVEEYDGYYDLDYVLGLDLYIESKRYGKIKIVETKN
ncbi:MAG: hypothetical protein U9R27_03665 [Campylobacterota bacterium]|nr:hypothetical protein [Campylobacterota bacterium]